MPKRSINRHSRRAASRRGPLGKYLPTKPSISHGKRRRSITGTRRFHSTMPQTPPRAGVTPSPFPCRRRGWFWTKSEPHSQGNDRERDHRTATAANNGWRESSKATRVNGSLLTHSEFVDHVDVFMT